MFFVRRQYETTLNSVSVSTEQEQRSVSSRMKLDPCEHGYILSEDGKNCLKYELKTYNFEVPSKPVQVTDCCIYMETFINDIGEIFFLTQDTSNSTNSFLLQKASVDKQTIETVNQIPKLHIDENVEYPYSFYFDRKNSKLYYFAKDKKIYSIDSTGQQKAEFNVSKITGDFNTEKANSMFVKDNEEKLLFLWLTHNGEKYRKTESYRVRIYDLNDSNKKVFDFKSAKANGKDFYSVSEPIFDSNNDLVFLEKKYREQDDTTIPFQMTSAQIKKVSNGKVTLFDNVVLNKNVRDEFFLAKSERNNPVLIVDKRVDKEQDGIERSRQVEFDSNAKLIRGRLFGDLNVLDSPYYTNGSAFVTRILEKGTNLIHFEGKTIFEAYLPRYVIGERVMNEAIVFASNKTKTYKTIYQNETTSFVTAPFYFDQNIGTDGSIYFSTFYSSFFPNDKNFYSFVKLKFTGEQKSLN